MRIDHLAIWAKDLDLLKEFYVHYFSCRAGEQYHNPIKNFKSYFLSFDDGSRLELMQMVNIPNRPGEPGLEFHGLAHFAISVGSKHQVDALIEELRAKNFRVVGEPRTTGDGYYESVVLDPEGNRIEITI